MSPSKACKSETVVAVMERTGNLSMSLSFEEILDHRMQCVELTSAGLDLAILGTIQSQTKRTSGCKRPCTNYFLMDKFVEQSFSFSMK